MYSNILIATDGSELAQKGIEHGLALARKLDAKVIILTASEPVPLYAIRGEFGAPGPTIDHEAYSQSARQSANGILEAAKAAADSAGVAVETVYVEEMRPAEAIVDIAKERDCDLIVMASHGRRGLDRLFLGSQTIEVLTHSPIPVLVVR